MSRHKLSQEEIKEVAHFLTRRSLTTSSGEYFASLNEYLETYNSLIDKMEEYNKTTD